VEKEKNYEVIVDELCLKSKCKNCPVYESHKEIFSEIFVNCLLLKAVIESPFILRKAMELLDSVIFNFNGYDNFDDYICEVISKYFPILTDKDFEEWTKNNQ